MRQILKLNFAHSAVRHSYKRPPSGGFLLPKQAPRRTREHLLT